MTDIPLAKFPVPLNALADADTATDGQVPTADGLGGVAWEAPTPGGGASGGLVKASRTTAHLTLNSTSWARMSTAANSSRRAALEEARARLTEALDEAEAARRSAEEALSLAADLSDLQAELDRLSGEVARDRASLAEEAQAEAR
mgnify:CR=1 FL=1